MDSNSKDESGVQMAVPRDFHGKTSIKRSEEIHSALKSKVTVNFRHYTSDIEHIMNDETSPFIPKSDQTSDS